MGRRKGWGGGKDGEEEGGEGEAMKEDGRDGKEEDYTPDIKHILHA